MKSIRQLTVILLSLLILTPSTVMAQEDKSLELTSSVLREVKVQDQKGETKTELVPVEKAMPGEELIVQVSYTNMGAEPAENIVIVNPVPDQMVYVAGSAAGNSARATFSIDGGATYDVPEKLLIKDEQGKEKQAPPERYTHIRFSRSQILKPGQTDTVTFRAVLK
jgi:uncharacterized repeat protein (TIGR01451 family)